MGKKTIVSAVDGVRGPAVSRRDFLKMSGAGIAGAALLGVAGCGGAGQQGGGPSVLVTVLDTEPQILNGFISGGDLAVTTDATSGILQGPLEILPDLSYAPQLADGEPQVKSEDPLIIEYRLKEGITFSDGEPLTSADAKWTFEQIMNPDNQIVSRIGWEDVEKFETPDERTVRLTFSTPYAGWRDLLDDDILPKHVYEGKDFNKALNNEIVGSGPFKFQEWNKGEDLTVVRNENYWGKKAGLERVTYRFISDSNTILQSLQSGEAGFIAPAAETGVFERIEGFPNTTVKSKAGTVWAHITFNVKKVPSVKFRQAIAYGINREQLATELLEKGLKSLDSVLVPDQEPFFAPAWGRYAHDPDKARQLLQEAEAEGVKPEITYTASSGSTLLERQLQIIQQQLEDIGLDVTLDFDSPENLLGKRINQGDFSMVSFSWVASPDPSSTELFAGDALPPKGQNYGLYENEEVTRLWRESDATVDPQARAELIRQAQEAMAQDVPILPLYQTPDIYAYTENLQGPEVNPTLAGPYWNMGEWTLQ